MIVFQGRLEGVPSRGAGARGVRRLRLLSSAIAVVVGHKTIVFLSLLLTTPDPPGHETQSAENDGTTDTDNDANDGVPRLGAHARATIIVLIGKSRSKGY